MKKVLFFMMLAMTVSMANAQRNNVKGPKAKNYKAYKDNTVQGTAVTMDNEVVLGPKAKNTKAGKGADGQINEIGTVAVREKGPKGKNAKAGDGEYVEYNTALVRKN